jgi:putative phage-type endonuclease
MSAADLNILDCEQRTPEWIEARIGKVTASRIDCVLAEIKKGEAASRRNYRAEIVIETLTGLPADNYISKEMQWGIDTEPFARAAYELQNDVMVATVGFANHPAIARFGASPDGLVGEDGLVEIKCPNTATHLDYLLTGEVPADYQPQMLVAMACTGRDWCDFVSFDPRMPQHLQLFVRRFERDNFRITEIEQKVEKFLDEVDEMLMRLDPPAPKGPQPAVQLMERQPDELAG